MDVDRPGVVGGVAVVEPERIGEPGVGLGQGDELARPRVVEADLAALLAGAGPGPRPAPAASRSRTAVQVGRIGDVDVGHLVVADGEGAAAERVEDLAERAGADLQAARPAAGRG